MHVNELELSVRAANALEAAGIVSVEELAKYDWLKFAEQNACGVKTIAEIASVMMRLACGKLLAQAQKWDQHSWAAKERNSMKAKLHEIHKISEI